MSRLTNAAAAAAAAIVIFVILTWLFIPDRQLERLVAREAESAGLTFAAARFGKAFPLGIAAKGVTIGDERGALVKADRVTVRLGILPLLTGKVALSYALTIGPGEVRGELFPRGGGMSTVEARGIRLEDIPFFATVTGAQVKGELLLRGTFGQAKGIASGGAQVEVKNADLRGIKIGDTPLPDAGYDTVRGALKASAGKLSVESLTLQGAGLYVRLSGDLPVTSPLSAAPLNLTLELMPKPDFLDRQKFVFLLLTTYQRSPGHYQIPIRGTLGKPALQ